MFQKSYREAGSGRRMSASHIHHPGAERGSAEARRQSARMNRGISGGMFTRGSRAQSHITAPAQFLLRQE